MTKYFKLWNKNDTKYTRNWRKCKDRRVIKKAVHAQSTIYLKLGSIICDVMCKDMECQKYHDLQETNYKHLLNKLLLKQRATTQNNTKINSCLLAKTKALHLTTHPLLTFDIILLWLCYLTNTFFTDLYIFKCCDFMLIFY